LVRTIIVVPRASAPPTHSKASSDLDEVVDGVLRASRVLVAVGARSIAAVDDAVTLPQFRTLVALASAGPQNVGALADDVGVHPSTATRMCDRLERKGLIERELSAASRREVIVKLTPAGRQLLSKVMTTRRREIRRVVAKVPEPLRQAMVDALLVFSDAAGDVPDQAWTVGWDGR
jgi:DNA-binding MarR family transcriptional regulator